MVAASVVAGVAIGGNASAQPNVIVFFVDDMGVADWEIDPVVNPTGSRVYETPNMLRLAREGVTFLNAYASAPVCSPSRASLMTGKSVARHGISDFIGGSTTASGSLVRTPDDWVMNVPASEVLLPERCRPPATERAHSASGTSGSRATPRRILCCRDSIPTSPAWLRAIRALPAGSSPGRTARGRVCRG